MELVSEVSKYLYSPLFKSQDGSVGIATKLRTGRSRLDSQQGLGIFLSTTASKPALGPIQPPIQWVPRVPSSGVKQPRREAAHSPPSIIEVKNVWRDKFTFTEGEWHFVVQ
jgi:hypothetical protein